jgi:hypothetical protein
MIETPPPTPESDAGTGDSRAGAEQGSQQGGPDTTTHTAGRTQASETVSNLFRRIIARENGGTISVGEMAQALEDRAFGPCILLFSLPGCVPGFPLMTSIFGPPMGFFGWQIAAGQHRPWLPKVISEKTLKRETLANFIDKAERYVVWFEKLCRPRWESLLDNWVERLIGVLVVLLSICVLIPLPGTNLIPCIAISMIALGFMQRDGVAVTVGIVVGIVGLIITYAIIAAALTVLGNAF